MDARTTEGDELEGRQLGDFVLRERIGRGGQGVVHRAEQLALGREAAVKIVPLAGKGEGVVLRFLREVKIAAQLDHPFAAHIYAFGAEPDLMWVAMEYVHGTPLDRLLVADGAIPLRRFLPLLERLCEVVHTAHEQGIVHRDIKPANVMVLSRAGRLLPKLLDLGIAKAVSTIEVTPEELMPPSEDRETPTRELRAESATAVVDAPAPLNESSTRIPADLSAVVNNASLRLTSDQPITRTGAVVGSPPYMAPEAWHTPSRVDGRVDVYALGVLTYECLTGRRPFRAELMSRLSDLHARAPIPELGAGFPPPIDHVVQRALAKRADDRYATPIELASALRAAASQTGSGLPRVEEDVRDAWIAQAPQPLAETLVLLDAARTEEQAWDGLALFKRAALRYLGVLALAMRTQGEHERSEALTLALAPLGKGPPSDTEWAAIIRAACASLVKAPDRCAVPELVAVTAAGGVLDALVSAGDERQRVDDESTNLPLAISALGQVMRQLAFVAEYPLAIRRGGELQALTGFRRAPRRTLAIADFDRSPDGAVVLVDRTAKLCLQLSPLVAVGRAALGLPEEVFVLDGHGARGMKQLVFPSLFERQDEDARAWFDANLPLGGDALTTGQEERPPYRGLSTFRTEDAASYFGREREVESFINRLRVQPLLTVVGPSGAGKSSFLQAGVLPALSSELITITVRPGRSPIATLVARMEREGISGLSVDGVRHTSTLLSQRVRLHTQMTGQKLVLIVDQLEELFTLCLDVDEREAYAAALVDLTDRAAPGVHVLFTLRDDFLVRAEELRAFRSRIGGGLQLLTTPQRHDLVRILAEPLKARRYGFEDEALIGEMVDAVKAQPGALALLSFTASQLWEVRDKHFHRLTRRAYVALGGVGGALAQHAEATLTALDEKEQTLAREAFRHLVTNQGTRATLTRDELQQLLGNDSAATSMLEKLVSARLLVSQEGEGGVDRVEIIHEALLTAWPRLMRWQREDAESARLRDSLRAAARQWEDRARTNGLLWRDDALNEYRVWRVRYRGALTSSEEAFAAASLREARRGQRIRRGVLVAAMVALTLFAGFMWNASKVARKANTRSVALLRGSYFDQARQLLLRGDQMQALVYLDEAQRTGAHGAAFDFLVSEAARPLRAQIASFDNADGSAIMDADLSADGRFVAIGTSSGFARIYDVERHAVVWEHEFPMWVEASRFIGADELLVVSDRATLLRWRPYQELRSGPVLGRGYAYDLSRDLHTVLYGSYDKPFTVLWDYETGKTLQRFNSDIATEMVGGSADGRRAWSTHWDVSGSLWDSTTGKRIIALPRNATRAAFAPDDRIAVLAGDDGELTTFDADGHLLRSIPFTHKNGGGAIAWSPDGKLIATGGDDHSVRVRDSATLGSTRELSGHTAPLGSVSFIEHGDVLMSAGLDGTVRFWDPRSTTDIAMIAGHTAQISAVRLSTDGQLVLTGSYDGTARLWRWQTARRTRVLSGTSDADVEQEVLRTMSGGMSLQLPANGSLSPRGDLVATFDEKRNLWITTLDGNHTCRVGDGTHAVFQSAFTPDSRYVVTAEVGNSSVGMWRTADCAFVRALKGHTAEVRAVSVSADGRYVVSGSADESARLWDAATGAFISAFPGNGAAVVQAEIAGDLMLVSACDSNKENHARKRMSAWRVRDGSLVWSRDATPHMKVQTTFEHLPSGRLLIVDDIATQVDLVEEATGRTLRTRKLPGAFFELKASPDGRRIVASVRGQNALVLDADTLANIGELEANTVHSIAFSRDSHFVFVAAIGVGFVFDLESRRLLAQRPDTEIVLTAPDRDRAVLLPSGKGSPHLWMFDTDPVSTQRLHELVRCRVPFKMEDGRVTKVTALPTDCPAEL